MALCQPQHPHPFTAPNADLRCVIRDNSQLSRYLSGYPNATVNEAVFKLFDGGQQETVTFNHQQLDGSPFSVLVNPPDFANYPAAWTANGRRVFRWDSTLFIAAVQQIRVDMDWPNFNVFCWIDHQGNPPHHSHGICFVSYGPNPTQMDRNKRGILRFLTSRAVMRANVQEI